MLYLLILMVLKFRLTFTCFREHTVSLQLKFEQNGGTDLGKRERDFDMPANLPKTFDQ